MKHPAKLSIDISFEIGTYICFLEQFFIEVFGLCMGVTTNFGAIHILRIAHLQAFLIPSPTLLKAS